MFELSTPKLRAASAALEKQARNFPPREYWKTGLLRTNEFVTGTTVSSLPE